VLVLEDLHWADEATIDLLSFLGRRAGRLPVLVIATYRDDALAEDHPLRIALGDLATQRGTGRLRLPSLSAGAVRSLAERDQAGPDGLDADELYRVTGGNPFYVSEVLAAGWTLIPATVRDAAGARLARAPAQARRAIETAAVGGARVSLSQWAAVLGTAPPLEDCLATGVLVTEGAGLRFRHELLRMAMADTIPLHRAIALHRRWLEVLTGAGGPDGNGVDADPAVLAHHSEGAADPAAVLRYAPNARSGSPRPAATRTGPPGTRIWPTSTRCWTAGLRPNGRCEPPSVCAGRPAISSASARTCACCPSPCGGCAAGPNPCAPWSRRPGSWRTSPPAGNWPGP
jgi:hypothetical protein